MTDNDTIFDGSPDGDTLGSRIVRAREAVGLTTMDLSKRIGVKKQTMEAWERDRSEPRANQAMNLAGILGVTPTWLLSGLGNAPSEEVVSVEIRSIRAHLDEIMDLRKRTEDSISAIQTILDRMVEREND
ncbi:MAG: helix-turn-helix domain-containing protein [Nitratireductor sp.]|nr:helix-turn-helix domain-containing protein [Nitratireductor sp.]MCC0020045.1 helix-turn-helix domain-containing protein [Nitratireductor sp.]